MAKKILYSVPIKFEGEAIVNDPAQYSAIDRDLARKKLNISISLENESGSRFNTVYPDQVEGELSFERIGNRIRVKANCVKKLAYSEGDEFPMQVFLTSIDDSTSGSYYFNSEENGIPTGDSVEAPEELLKKKKSK